MRTTAGALVVVDNTFLSPALQQPIVARRRRRRAFDDEVPQRAQRRRRRRGRRAREALGDELAWWANCLGVTGAPFDSYLTLRGVRTLHVRMTQHSTNAQAVVDALSRSSDAARGLLPWPRRASGPRARARQQTGFGAMVSFEVRGGRAGVETFTSKPASASRSPSRWAASRVSLRIPRR